MLVTELTTPLSTETVDNLRNLECDYFSDILLLPWHGTWEQLTLFGIILKIIWANNAMHHITIQRAVPKNEMPSAAQLKQWAKEGLKCKTSSDVEMNIRIVDLAEITELNEQYRHKSGATNVLSFPFDMPLDLMDELPSLGDVVICAAVVNQEAQEQGKSTTAHWAHMVIHGTLHLLGYDHETVADATIMESLEVTILKELGFSDPYQQGEK